MFEKNIPKCFYDNEMADRREYWKGGKMLAYMSRPILLDIQKNRHHLISCKFNPIQPPTLIIAGWKPKYIKGDPGAMIKLEVI